MDKSIALRCPFVQKTFVYIEEEVEGCPMGHIRSGLKVIYISFFKGIGHIEQIWENIIQAQKYRGI